MDGPGVLKLELELALGVRIVTLTVGGCGGEGRVFAFTAEYESEGVGRRSVSFEVSCRACAVGGDNVMASSNRSIDVTASCVLGSLDTRRAGLRLDEDVIEDASEMLPIEPEDCFECIPGARGGRRSPSLSDSRLLRFPRGAGPDTDLEATLEDDVPANLDLDGVEVGEGSSGEIE